MTFFAFCFGLREVVVCLVGWCVRVVDSRLGIDVR